MVLRYDISPWKLFGWSMYCKPNSPVVVELHSIREDGSTRMIMVQDMPEKLLGTLQEWTNRRRVWGTLTSPRELANAVFQRWSSMNGVSVKIYKWELNPDNGWYEIQEKSYRYIR